jgi:hypothetical protein
MFRKRGRGQSWSLDIILAFVIFVLIIGIFYALLNSSNSKNTDYLQLEANAISNNLDDATGMNSTLSIMDKGSIDKEKLQLLFNSTYDHIKRQFGIRGEFCIYLVDQYGKIWPIQRDAEYVNGFGNGNISLNGKPCGSVMT